MALRKANQVKRITASGGGTLTPDEDESYIVRNIWCVPSSNDTYLTLYNDDRTIGKIRVQGKGGNHLAPPNLYTSAQYEAVPGTIFDIARRLGAPLDIPIRSGDSLTISRYAETGNVMVLYDVFDKDDVKGDEINGAMGKTLRYVHYAQTTAAITAATTAINSSLIWTGGSKWPIDASAVPLNTTFTIYALGALPAAKGNGSANKGYTDHLQLILDNDTLFDPDRSGLPLLGDSSVTAATVSYKSFGAVLGVETKEYPNPLYPLTPPLVCGPGRRITFNLLTTDAASSGILAAEVDVALLMEQTIGG